MLTLSQNGVRRSRSSRKAKDRKFVPENPAGQATARLEGRHLAAPALWRYPTGSAQAANDNTSSTINTSIEQSVGEFSSHVSHVFTDIRGTTTGTATTTIVDNADPAPPADPIGSYGASMSTSSDISWTGGDTGYGTAVIVDTYGYRNYQIADDSSSPASNWKIKETLQVSWNAPPATILNPMFVGVNTTITTPGLSVTLDGTNSLTSDVTIDGSSKLIGASGTFTTSGGTVVTYTSSGSSAYITATTPLGTLASATTNPVSGRAWAVNYHTHIYMAAGQLDPTTTSLDANLSYTYTASFTNI